MAGLASFFEQHSMNNLLLEGIFFMASVTDVIPLCHQHGWRLGAMGVMALRTLATLERRMNIFPCQTDFGRCMAVQADFVALFLEQQLGNPSVAEMAVFAFFLLDDRMEVFHGKKLCFKFLVAVQTVLAGQLSSGVAVRSDPGNHAPTEKQHDER